MTTREVAGTRLFVVDNGGAADGSPRVAGRPPAVFLHGFLFDGRQYEAQIRALQAEYRCITIDFPGQGRSGPSTVGYSTQALTDLVITCLDLLRLGPVHLVGLSMGGFTSMRIAVQRPDLVASLAMLNTSARAHDRGKYPRQLALAAVARVTGTGLPPVTAGIEREMYGSTFLSDPTRDTIRREWRQRWAATDRAALVDTLWGFMRRPDFRSQLSSISAPSLIIGGGDDVSLPVVQSEELARGIDGSELVVLPRAGHSAPVEDPDAVTDALRSFWQGLPPG